MRTRPMRTFGTRSAQQRLKSASCEIPLTVRLRSSAVDTFHDPPGITGRRYLSRPAWITNRGSSRTSIPTAREPTGLLHASTCSRAIGCRTRASTTGTLAAIVTALSTCTIRSAEYDALTSGRARLSYVALPAKVSTSIGPTHASSAVGRTFSKLAEHFTTPDQKEGLEHEVNRERRRAHHGGRSIAATWPMRHTLMRVPALRPHLMRVRGLRFPPNRPAQPPEGP